MSETETPRDPAWYLDQVRHHLGQELEGHPEAGRLTALLQDRRLVTGLELQGVATERIRFLKACLFRGGYNRFGNTEIQWVHFRPEGAVPYGDTVSWEISLGALLVHRLQIHQVPQQLPNALPQALALLYEDEPDPRSTLLFWHGYDDGSLVLPAGYYLFRETVNLTQVGWDKVPGTSEERPWSQYQYLGDGTSPESIGMIEETLGDLSVIILAASIQS